MVIKNLRCDPGNGPHRRQRCAGVGLRRPAGPYLPGVPKDLSDPGQRAGKHPHELGSNTGAGARGCQAGADR